MDEFSENPSKIINNKRLFKRKRSESSANTSVNSKFRTKEVRTNSKSMLNLSNTEAGTSSNWKNLQKIIYRNHPKKRLRKNSPTVQSCDNTAVSSTAEDQGNDEIWFDDVDDFLIVSAAQDVKSLVDTNGTADNQGITQCVAIDCEMVGVGYAGKESMLARVSIVNQFGHCLMDKYVKPREDVSDYRTKVSGITPELVAKAHDFNTVQKQVCEILEGRILVGHAVKNDLKALFLSHPRAMIRDTSCYKPFRQMSQGRTPSLRFLSKTILGVTIQSGEHNSVEDAQAAMKIFTLIRKDWEKRKGHKKPIHRVKKKS